MRITAILAAVLVAGAAMPAAAADEVSTSLQVKFADLDLSTEAGQQQLDRRIDSAARAACGMDEASTGSRIRSSSTRRCFENARTSVHKQVAELIARDKSRG